MLLCKFGSYKDMIWYSTVTVLINAIFQSITLMDLTPRHILRLHPRHLVQ